VDQLYFDQLYFDDAHQLEWSEAFVDGFIDKVRKGEPVANYPDDLPHIKVAIEDLQVQGKRILVIGSETPWLEAMLLFAGAAHVTTLE